ncbi:MAG: efflux RND transporter permease subunit [Verrucomicrobiota bacterium]
MAAQKRLRHLRPKMMTVAAALMGLMPIMWSLGTGADLMKRVAAPMVGGLFTSFIMELLFYPAIYFLWRSRHIKTDPVAGESASAGGGVVRV